MDYERCYYDNDLRLFFQSMDEASKTESLNSVNYHNSYYSLIFFNSKKAAIVFDNNKYYVDEPVLIAAKPALHVKFLDVHQPLIVFYINIHPSVFEKEVDSDKFLEFFYSLSGEQLIFRTNQPHFSSLKQYIDSIQTALFAKCGRFTVETRVKALITELNFIYETIYRDYVEITDSIPVQIINYTEKHYMEKITLETLSEKFFVSFNTINSIFKRITGVTFKKYVTDLRLNTANDLIESGSYTMYEVAQLCGFSEYATFLRAYSKKFGIVPSKSPRIKLDYFPLKK